MTSLIETYAEDRRVLRDMVVRYGNSVVVGAGEVAFLAGRAARQIQRLEEDLEKGLQDGRANGGGVSRGEPERAGGGSPDPTDGRADASPQAKGSDRA